MRLSKKVTHYSVLLTLFLLPICMSATSETDEKKLHISPSNTVFIFDFDDVVVTREFSKIALSTIRAFANHPWVLLLLTKSSFYKDIVHSITQNLCTGKKDIWGLYYYLDHFEKVHTYFTADIKEALLCALNKHKPITTRIQTIRALKNRGYRIYILTNKDHVSLLQYVKPYLKKYHHVDLDEIFDDYFCANHIYQKPDTAFYALVAEKLCSNTIKHLVFFDDNKINVENARKTNSCFMAFHIPQNKHLKEYGIINEALKTDLLVY